MKAIKDGDQLPPFPFQVVCIDNSGREEAIKAWRAGEKLPEHFHALNLDAAKKSWQEGVKRDGVGVVREWRRQHLRQRGAARASRRNHLRLRGLTCKLEGFLCPI
jgi:hypothetical protein